MTNLNAAQQKLLERQMQHEHRRFKEWLALAEAFPWHLNDTGFWRDAGLGVRQWVVPR